MIASGPCAAAGRWMLAIALALALLVALSSAADAQSALVPAPQTAAQETGGGPWQTALQYLHQKQGELHRRLASAVRGLKGEGSQQALLFLLTLSFLYGVFHAVGPGHGKAVISTYLLANERAVRRGIALAFLASFVQGLTAIALVALLAVLLDMSGLRVTAAVGMLESASYALVAAVGFWLLWSVLRQRRSAKGTAAGHEAGCCGHNHHPDPSLLSGKGLLSKAGGIIAAVGIRPCSGAVLVLLFALFHGVFVAGVAATAAMSLGTAASVSLLALATLYSKRLAFAALGDKSRWVDATYHLLGLGGAVMLILLGLGLFATSLGPAPPLSP
ncbi:nickel/cobalt transporter [Pelagibius sp.]|uniref:nickel/cobalt transporter n=1 Tax=Pelagibius sp. TaxID=1931238 RepID=UPI00262AC93A|nr:nickel/cobalt transporter [Pelagibius sp.]